MKCRVAGSRRGGWTSRGVVAKPMAKRRKRARSSGFKNPIQGLTARVLELKKRVAVRQESLTRERAAAEATALPMLPFWSSVLELHPHAQLYLTRSVDEVAV